MGLNTQHNIMFLSKRRSMFI